PTSGRRSRCRSSRTRRRGGGPPATRPRPWPSVRRSCTPAREEFVQGGVVQSRGAQYVSYQRTYAGLPVVAGDFVVVTKAKAEVVAPWVARRRRVGTLPVPPAGSEAPAEATATKQMQSVTGKAGTRLVVDMLGDSPRLAWESTLDGVRDKHASELAVTVDAV